ncbi:phosphopantetheine-binding protein, partial [Fischerella thermalis]|uniref:phosphopantetheine-binding protein n=1 Tax=Fischerella thermalis TaxID=372787 RepID=UPI000CB5F914
LSEAEQQQLLVEWNDTETEYPNQCIHQLFAAQVERTPDAVAVIFQDEQLTYTQLNQRANQLAHYLQKLGVKPEVLEALLNQYPGVETSIALIREDEPASQRLVAYVLPQPNQTLTIPELRHFLKSKLPNYMVPTAFVTLEALPLTPNGKVDRKALPAPDQTRPELETTYQPPQNDLEQTIANIWQEVLHVKEVGIYDNFFELGGQSLLLVQVHSKLQKILPQDLSLVEMFQYPTISSLAKYLSQEQNKPAALTKDSYRTEVRTASIKRRREVRQNYRKTT